MLRLPPTEIKVEAIEVELQLPSVLVAWEGVRSGTTWARACWVVRVVLSPLRVGARVSIPGDGSGGGSGDSDIGGDAAAAVVALVLFLVLMMVLVSANALSGPSDAPLE